MKSPEPPARFKKTVSLRQILNYVSVPYHEVYQEFEKWPILEIREACLRNLREREIRSTYIADWAETCIKELWWNRDEIAKEVLSWYVFAAKSDDVRAIEFAIALSDDVGLGVVSKLVCGRICKEPFLYPHLPSLPAFLDKLLHEIMPYHSGEKREYVDIYWICAERALKMIMAGKDYSFSFLPKIEEIILFLQNGVIFPSKYEPLYVKDLHLVMLKSTAKILKQAQREALRNPEN